MNYRYNIGGPGGPGNLPPAVKGLLIANGIVFLLQGFFNPAIVNSMFGLVPANFWRGAVWQPLTYMFMHAGLMHILFNMLMLWMFGSVLESAWGKKEFIRFYFLTGIGAGLSNCFLTPSMPTPIIGASGSMYGLLAAYGILFPDTRIYISFLIPIRAKYVVLIFGFLSLMSSFGNSGDGIAHIVHLGGMVIGVIYLKRKDFARLLGRKIKSYQVKHKQTVVQKEQESDEQLRQEVDDLLDKINEVGMNKLTTREVHRLKKASELLNRKENSQF
ncbi:MAG: rhomboid family intramembrane serine protease [Calditrichaeota bacterium]|nr:rhomboid family intramembrane serine protease [Calditrichota bacterium]MBT7617603.1 rhomboid family intramembrane serine protease [Calditrichota bacterium]MBT7790000.1 rhomboid family intramembrane serine protease [Calditrichota bacterium]